MEYILMVYNRLAFSLCLLGSAYFIAYLFVTAAVFFSNDGEVKNIPKEHKKLIKYGFFILIGIFAAMILLP